MRKNKKNFNTFENNKKKKEKEKQEFLCKTRLDNIDFDYCYY